MEDKYPNPKGHKIISFIKSGIRVIGFFSLIPFPEFGIGMLIFAELVGVLEELV